MTDLKINHFDSLLPHLGVGDQVTCTITMEKTHICRVKPMFKCHHVSSLLAVIKMKVGEGGIDVCGRVGVGRGGGVA